MIDAWVESSRKCKKLLVVDLLHQTSYECQVVLLKYAGG